MKYSIITFGCRVNQADSLGFEEELLAAGARPASAEDADLDRRQHLFGDRDRRSGRAADHSTAGARRIPRRRIVVTGCYATRRPDDVAALPNVAAVVPNDDKPRLLRCCARPRRPAADPAADGAGARHRRALRRRRRQLRRRRSSRASPAAPHSRCGCRPAAPSRAPTASSRRPAARRAASPLDAHPGGGRSRRCRRVQGNRADRRASRVVRPRSRAALVAGRTARRAGGLAADAARRRCCSGSARSSRWTARRRSSRLVAEHDCFAPHFHLPLQHASDRMLAAMRRPYTLDYYAALVDAIRARIPHASIGSDIIVGFPGETRRRLRAAGALSGGFAAHPRSRVSLLGAAGHRGGGDCRARCRARSCASGRAGSATSRRDCPRGSARAGRHRSIGP